MEKERLSYRVWASLMHLFSLLLTFILPIVVYLLSKGRNDYFTQHAKEGMNLHFTFFPIFLTLTFMSQKFSVASTLSIALLILETILIIIATVCTLIGKKFSYPVIKYFKV